MNLLIFGAPGSGKGTQSALLVARHGYRHISSGDLFRNAIKSGTPLGIEAKGFMDKGELVPDSLTVALVEEEIKQNKGISFILDGFPRNVSQAETLNSLLGKLDLKIGKVLFLDVPHERLKERLTGRRICKNCGASYHISTAPTKNEGVCDRCGGFVEQRKDDQENVIENRLRVYSQSTEPLREFYKKQGLFIVVDGLGSAEEVYKRIEMVLEK